MVVIFLILYCYLIYIYQYFVCLHDGVTKIDSKKMFKNYIHCYVCFIRLFFLLAQMATASLNGNSCNLGPSIVIRRRLSRVFSSIRFLVLVLMSFNCEKSFPRLPSGLAQHGIFEPGYRGWGTYSSQTGLLLGNE